MVFWNASGQFPNFALQFLVHEIELQLDKYLMELGTAIIFHLQNKPQGTER